MSKYAHHLVIVSTTILEVAQPLRLVIEQNINQENQMIDERVPLKLLRQAKREHVA